MNTGKTSKLRGSDLFLITVNPTEPGHKDNNNNDNNIIHFLKFFLINNIYYNICKKNIFNFITLSCNVK